MDIKLSDQHIKEIAQDLEKGLTCHIHCKTGKIISFPEVDLADFGEEDQWFEDRREVEENWVDYLVILPPSPKEVLEMIRQFLESVDAGGYRNSLLQSLEMAHPFREFKKSLHDFPTLRKEWFRYKDEKYRNWIRLRLDES
ncbi:MAG: UPF0158 family protein [Marinifilaceae bacterium]